MSFNIEFTSDSYDSNIKGWNHQLFLSDGFRVKSISSSGETLDSSLYSINDDFLSWKGDQVPSQITIEFEESNSQKEKVEKMSKQVNFWKIFSTMIPIIVAIIGAITTIYVHDTTTKKVKEDTTKKVLNQQMRKENREAIYLEECYRNYAVMSFGASAVKDPKMVIKFRREFIENFSEDSVIVCVVFRNEDALTGDPMNNTNIAVRVVDFGAYTDNQDVQIEIALKNIKELESGNLLRCKMFIAPEKSAETIQKQTSIADIANLKDVYGHSQLWMNASSIKEKVTPLSFVLDCYNGLKDNTKTQFLEMIGA